MHVYDDRDEEVKYNCVEKRISEQTNIHLNINYSGQMKKFTKVSLT